MRGLGFIFAALLVVGVCAQNVTTTALSSTAAGDNTVMLIVLLITNAIMAAERILSRVQKSNCCGGAVSMSKSSASIGDPAASP